MDPIYSIIVPHHNIPDLLQRLLNSIPQREDTEILITDDNSDPNIVDFDNFPGKDRPDVKIFFDKEGGGKGCGHPRNVALPHARGKFILMADADDFFTPCFNDVLDKYANSDADIVYFNATCVDTNTYLHGKRARRLNKLAALYDKDPEKSKHLLNYLVGWSQCKLIRREFLIEHDLLKFREICIHEDYPFSIRVGYYAKKIEVETRAVYVITVRLESMSLHNMTEFKRLVRIQVFADSEKFFKDHNIDVPFCIPSFMGYYQMCWSMFQCWDTFKKGFKFYKEQGFSTFHIMSRTLVLLPRVIAIALAVKFVDKGYMDV